MKKISFILGIMIALMCEGALILINFIPKPLNTNNDSLAMEQVIYSKEITIDSLIKKYDEKLELNNFEKMNLEYLTIIDNTYYIGLFQDVILFITPTDLSNCVYQTGIIVDEDTNNFDLALLYYQLLIEANNEFIFNSQELVNLVVEGKLVSRNNGLILGYINDNYEINFFIERKYND